MSNDFISEIFNHIVKFFIKIRYIEFFNLNIDYVNALSAVV